MGRLPIRIILLAAAVCIFAAVVALYARSAIFDDAPFADRAVATLAQDEVADEIVQRFTNGVVERSPGLVTLRPAIEEAAADVVASPVFAAEFGAGMGALRIALTLGVEAERGEEIAQLGAVVAARDPVEPPRGQPLGLAFRASF